VGGEKNKRKMKQIAFVPPHVSPYCLNDGVFNASENYYFEPYEALKNIAAQRSIELHTFDCYSDWALVDTLFMCDMPLFTHLKLWKQIKAFSGEKILALLEPPVVRERIYRKKHHESFDKVLTWNEELVDNKKYFKLPYFQYRYGLGTSWVPYGERKFLTLINSNKRSYAAGELYSARYQAIKYFSNQIPDRFDLFGDGWATRPRLMSFSTLSRFSLRGYVSDLLQYKVPETYRGRTQDKFTTLRQYKFAICYENMTNVSGYVTEKIMDCFKCGVVPVYWGANNIADTVPTTCFIDKRRFSTYSELEEFMSVMTEHEYNDYLMSIRSYLSTFDRWPSSPENWAKAVIKSL